ncbi:unnamed protein product [Adineta ricciae]|uniref:PKD/REJ-like domain-containing protein n=1 Tax=Adineta ricciae TaxID=249248 RepID=A0A814QAD0_ADIRI|nr:unnamed protein product [Adineta ricciae]
MTSQTSKTIFLAGCGGGYDVFGCLPYYFKLKASGDYDITLINYTFTKLALLTQHSEQVTTVLFRVDPQANIAWLTDDVYFPEQRLANELQVPIYAILCDYTATRIELIVEAYKHLIHGRCIDELALIDGGSDVLLTGNELELGTPVEDISHARAVDLLSTDEVKAKYIVVIGINLEVGHDVQKSDIDARVAALSSDTIFKWLWQYEHDDDVRRYVEIFHRCSPSQSIVHSLICAALEGRRGYYLPEHLRDRIRNSVVELSDETCISIVYRLNDVMRHNVYFQRLIPEMNLNQVFDEIYDSIDDDSSSIDSTASSQKSDSDVPHFIRAILSSNNKVWRLILVISYYQPQFCPLPTWNSVGIPFANESIVGKHPIALFIDKNDTVYVANRDAGQILIWLRNSTIPSQTLTDTLNDSHSLFVSDIGDIYIDNGFANKRVAKWISSTSTFTTVMAVDGPCEGLFIDINQTLYCSMFFMHKIVKKWLNNASLLPIIAAGTGTAGPGAHEISQPGGIFVDTNFDLYVADCGNNRVQLYKPGNPNGTTVAGDQSRLVTYTLHCPSGVTLDYDKYLFIVENTGHRVIGSGPYGFRCLVGCGGEGSQAHQLSKPFSFAFDSYGNMFISDQNNHRIQKFFLLLNNSCDETTINSRLTSELTTSESQQDQINSQMVPSMTIQTEKGTVSKNFPFSNTPSSQLIALSLNQPNLCPTATWAQSGITFANETIIGRLPIAIFINRNNTIYIPNRDEKNILVWENGAMTPTKNISGKLSYLASVFVTNIGDIYITNGGSRRRIDKWISSSNTFVTIMYVNTSCFSLFVDIDEDIYCSLYEEHKVFKIQVNDSTPTVIAGTGSSGSSTSELNGPMGIFIDANFDFYVADCHNNRIQFYRLGQSQASTVLGKGSSDSTFRLNCPSGIAIDANRYLFVVDSSNHRVVGSGPYGFRCLIGCDKKQRELKHPRVLSFDSYGNIFISDRDNNRTQKYLFLNESCNLEQTSISPMTSKMVTTSITKDLNNASQCIVPPSIQLAPELSSTSEYQRNEEIFLSSSVEFICNKPFLIYSKWTISNSSQELQFNAGVVETTYNDLYIPPNTLPVGLYQVKLTISTSISSTLTSHQSIYIQINPSGIILNLIPHGISMITHEYRRDLQLNPGKYSIDLDGNTFNANAWTYKYSCWSSSNITCLVNKGWKYDDLIESSITVFNHVFQVNQIYEFHVEIINKKNSSAKFSSFLIVKIQEKSSPFVTINCVILTLCIPQPSYQLINPRNQLFLHSQCFENCSNVQYIRWNIYYSLSDVHNWVLFNQTDTYENVSIFGRETNRLTITNDVFSKNQPFEYWKYEVVYSFDNAISSSSCNFRINQPPTHGWCEITRLNGTITTLFNISCSNWTDEHTIKDYSLFCWKTDPNKLTIVAFSVVPNFQVRLPSGHLHLVIHIRDRFDSYSRFNLSSIHISSNLSEFNDLIKIFSTTNINTNNQILSSISHELNQLNDENIHQAVSDGIPFVNIAVSPLNSKHFEQIIFASYNLDEYTKNLNFQSNLRETFIQFNYNLTIEYILSLHLQSSTLVHLTQSTNQLTQTTLLIALKQCVKLSQTLHSISTRISYEDARTVTTELLQSVANILTGFHGPLQQRMVNLHWKLFNVDDLTSQINRIISYLTSTLIIHLNAQQDLIIDTQQISFSIRYEQSQKNFLRSIVMPLAPNGNQLETKLSRSVSRSFVDFNGNEVITMRTAKEIIIPRDPNFILPRFILQNVSTIEKSFNFKLLSIQPSYSIHFDIDPMNSNASYLFIYQFSHQRIDWKHLSGLTLLCQQNLTNEHYYSYYIDNQQTVDHHSLIFGLRELTSDEILIYCSSKTNHHPPIVNEDSHFTTNYQLRIYSSSCFYMDDNNQWKSDELIVGPESNLYHTQCFVRNKN